MTSLKRGRGASVLAVASALVLLLSSCGGGSSGGGEAFNGFGGQDVEILVPTGAGGGTDTTARFIAERIPSHLNDPSIHITNVDGASHIVGMNEFEKKRDHDGLHWLMSSGTGHLPYLFGEPAIQFDLGELNPILASPVGNVVIVNKDAGVTNVKDLKGKTLVYGGSGPVGSDTTQLLGLDLLGVNLQPLFGFDEGPQRIAFEQGEIDVIYNTTPAYLSGGKDLVDRGVGVPLYTAGQLVNGEVVRDPAFPDLPSIAEAYETINGKQPSGAAMGCLQGAARRDDLVLEGDVAARRRARGIRQAGHRSRRGDGQRTRLQGGLGRHPRWLRLDRRSAGSSTDP